MPSRASERTRGGRLGVQINLTLTDRNLDQFDRMVDYCGEMGVAVHPLFPRSHGRALSMAEEELKSEGYFSMIRKILEKQGKTSMELKPTCAPGCTNGERAGDPPAFFTGVHGRCLHCCCILPRGGRARVPVPAREAGNVRKNAQGNLERTASVFWGKLRDASAYEELRKVSEYIDICSAGRAPSSQT